MHVASIATAIPEMQAEDHFVAALTPKQPILELLNLEGGF